MTVSADSSTDRTATIVRLLDDLGQRLRQSDTAQTQIRAELESLRALFSETTVRTSLAERLHEAFDARLENHEQTVETVIRRLTALEEGVERQSGSLLAILRKLEERFDAYDLSRRENDAQTEENRQILERLEEKVDRLAQDKQRLTRKVDVLEETLARSLKKGALPGDEAGTAAVAGTDAGESGPSIRQTLQVWTASSAQPKFMQGPDERLITTAPANWVEREGVQKAARFAAVGLIVLALSGGIYGVISSLMQHPGDQPEEAVIAFTPPETEENGALQGKPEEKPSAPQELFSKAVASEIAARMKTALAQEEKAAQALISKTQQELKKEKIQRDTSLPRPIAAIEDRAAEGDPQAQHDLAALYTSGQAGVGVDYTRAAQWFRRAAVQGVGNARYNLGVLYQQGLGVEKDVDQALRWYQAASQLGHPEAQYNLGIAYVEGIGAEYDPALAAGYFEKAAKAGVVEAAFNLGLLLENGLIEQPRPTEALFWYTLAAAGGEKQAVKAAQKLQEDLRLSQADEAALIQKMKAARPDVTKVLTSKETARSVAAAQATQTVRVHTLSQKTEEAKIESVSQNRNEELDLLEEQAKEDNTTAAEALPRVVPPARPANIVPAEEEKPGTIAKANEKSPDQAEERKIDPDSELVMKLQARLAGMGFFPGTPSGKMGPVTVEAIRRYQMANNLEVNGQPSTGLLAHMLARQLEETAQPAAGEKEPESNPESNKVKADPLSQKHIKVNQ